MANLLRVGWVLAFACTILAYPAVFAVGSTATEAYFITPHDEKRVRINEGLFEMEDHDRNAPDYPRKVMKIYGLPNESPDRVVFVAKGKFLHPKHLPSLTLLPVDKEKGENPLQEKTLYFFAKWIVRGAGAVGIALFAIWCLALRLSKPAPTP